MTIHTAKVNGELLRAAREENWTWEEAQENLKQTYGEDAELVSSMSEELFEDLMKFKLEEV